MSDNVVPVAFKTRYAELADLKTEILEVIYGYAERGVPVATVLGVLRLIEHELIANQESS